MTELKIFRWKNTGPNRTIYDEEPFAKITDYAYVIHEGDDDFPLCISNSLEGLFKKFDLENATLDDEDEE